jgi:type IV pilus assembly protein PilA
MGRIARTSSRAEDGFTLIELLVVILIIGILAAIAIPSFLAQKNKANDAGGKEVARTAMEAAEAFSTDNGGNYTGISPKVLNSYDPQLQIEEGGNNGYLKTASEAESGYGYVLTAVAAGSKDTFTITRNQNGEIKRTCAAAGSNKTGCISGTW